MTTNTNIRGWHLPVERWLQTRLERQFDPAISLQLESSPYGALNAPLTSQFPIHRKFLVKPQASLRATTTVDGTDLDEAVVLQVDEKALNEPIRPGSHKSHSTITSGGAISTQRAVLADFVVARAHERLYYDWIVCIVEVKREPVSESTASEQLAEYLRRASKETHKLGYLYGFLVSGSTWRAYCINTRMPEYVWPVSQSDPILGGGLTFNSGFKKALFHIARRYWDDVDDTAWRGMDFQGHYEIDPNGETCSTH